jgi:hypothetical protein
MLHELPALTPPSTPIAAIGIDLNRFPSWRAISYGLLSDVTYPGSPDHRAVDPSPQVCSELITHLPRLIGLNYSTQIEISLNTTEILRVQEIKRRAKRQRDRKFKQELYTQRRKETDIERFFRVNRTKVSPSDPSHYLNNVLRKAYAWEKELLPNKFYLPKKYRKVPMATQITQILNQRCQNAKNPSKTLSFNDVISAPIIYWTQKLRHIERHIAQAQTVHSKLSRGDPKKKRLAGEITLLHHRRQTLRNEINRYMARTLFYVIRKFKTAVIGYENLSGMTTFGTKGYMAKITQEMIKQMGTPSLTTDTDFSSILARVNVWCRLSDPPLDVAFREVNARNTSKFHYHCGGEINRKPSWDFGSCTKERCGAVHDIDTHVNAAHNIASRAKGHTGLGPP